MGKMTLAFFPRYTGTRTMSNFTKTIRPSATLIIAAPIPHDKDQPKVISGTTETNYRLLMMKRNALSSFVNAHVFPGGIVDEQDHASHWQSHLRGSNETTDIITHKICAIRETFEESGLLLTHPTTTSLDLDIESWRRRVHSDASQFKVMCETFQLTPAVDKLVPFASWITPITEKKRYNTKFFLTVLGQTQDKGKETVIAASADGKETLEFDWYKPNEALEAWRQKDIVLFPPQWYCLHVMQRTADYQNLQKDAGVGTFRTRQGEILTILPQIHDTPKNDDMALQGYHKYMAYPGDENYVQEDTDTNTHQSGQKHRIYFKGRMQEFLVINNLDRAYVAKARI